MTKKEAKEQLAKLGDLLTAEQKQALSAALDNEQFLDGVAEFGMLKADYSKEKNKLAEERKKAEQEYTTKYSQLEEWAKQHGSTIEQARKVYADWEKYRQTFGDLNGDAPKKDAPPPGMTAEQIAKLWEEREARLRADMGKGLLDTAYVISEHQRRFKEAPDIEEINRFIQEKQEEYGKQGQPLSVRQAYELYAAPRLNEMKEQEFAAKLKAAKEEAVRDYASKHHLPIDPPASKQRAPIWDAERMEAVRKEPWSIEDKAEAGFFEAYAEAANENR